MKRSRLLLVWALANAACGDDEPAEETMACGSWVVASKTSSPPPGAESYGHEGNSMGSFQQYVCRFNDSIDGRKVTMQGKGVFGFGCYAVLPPSDTAPLRVQASDRFEVLVGTRECARMVPYDPAAPARLLPTGVDVDGAETHSCRGIVDSADVPGKSMPLGRFDRARGKCVFEWYNNVREAPAALTPEDKFEVLAWP